MKGTVKNILAISACTLFVISSVYGCYVLFSATMVYRSLKNNGRGWYGRVHQHDPVLGFAPIPGAQGTHVFPIGPDVPMRYNREGFRVPMHEDIDPEKRPLFLFLGCSYTYGDACTAEEAFPYLVGKYFNATAINAGVCGYGLAQMYFLAQKLIPKHRPDVVIVQHSNWLVNRAAREFSPTYFSQIPYPYYAEEDGKFFIAPPVFRTRLFDRDISQYRASGAGVADYFSFVTGVVFPIKAYDDMHYAGFLLKKLCGIIPKPTSRPQEACDFFYSRIHELCKENSASMIILGIREQPYTISPDFIYIHAEEGLKRNLQSGADYSKMYAHWRGDPPVKVDNHPNPLAHRIIAAEVIEKIDALLKQQ